MPASTPLRLTAEDAEDLKAISALLQDAGVPMGDEVAVEMSGLTWSMGELLRSKLSTMVSAPVFISSIVRNQQTLHRVRLGPISTPGEVTQLQDSVRLANLGQPTLVKGE